MRKYIFTFFVFFSLFFLGVEQGFSADTCKYKEKIKRCNDAILDMLLIVPKVISPWASIKSVEDFPCLQDVPEKRVFQIVMDEKFKLIDTELEEYLQKIFTQKSLYFGKTTIYNYADGIDDIWKKNDELKAKYTQACNEVVPDAIQCVWDVYWWETQYAVSNLQAADFLSGSDGVCSQMVNFKLYAFREVAYNWLLQNSQQIAADYRKLYKQWQLQKYNKVLDLMRVNLSYVTRMWKKVTKITVHTL